VTSKSVALRTALADILAPVMWRFLRREFLFFLVGFIITFLIYLFVKFDANDVVNGILLGLVGGIILAIALTFLERQFPDNR
jgi:cell division protein FtsW (lipid II flippase)